MKTRRLVALLAGTAIAACVAPVHAATSTTPDTQAPSVSVVTPTGGEDVAGKVKFTGTASDNAKLALVEYSIDGVTFQKAGGKSSWKVKFNSTTYADGAHDLFVRATDKTGNQSTKTVPFDITNVSPTPSSPPASDPPPSDPPPSNGPRSMTTPEGTQINVTSQTYIAPDTVYQMLKENGLDSTIGPTLTVEVQDQYPSQTSTSASSSGGRISNYKAIIYLQGSSTTFKTKPDYAIGHEFGHAWTLYYLYMAQQNDWSSYLQARGLTNDSRVDSSYNWSKNEMIADDYRLLLGSSKAISETPTHLNTTIPDPREVPGLKTFLQNSWTTPR